jgi:hypothetical protein
VGVYALQNNSGGNNNIAVGYGAGANIFGNNNIDIGHPGMGADANTIRVGVQGQHTAAYVAGIWGTPLGGAAQTVVVDSAGHLGVGSSGSGVTSVTGSQHITASPTTGAVVVGSDATPSLVPLTIVSRDTNGSFNANNIALGGSVNCLNQVGVLNLPWTTANGGMITMGGCSATFLHAFGSSNFFGGSYAGNLTLTGTDNVGLGAYSLHFDTTGYYNTAIGAQSLYNNTDGVQNTAVGYQALFSNTSGYNNTASGEQALYSNTSGVANTANGVRAMYYNQTGDANTAQGQQALYSNTNAADNTAVGFQSLFANTAAGNTALGRSALGASTSGNYNIAVGYNAGVGLSSGNYNIYIGNQGDGEDFTANESNIIRIGPSQSPDTNAPSTYVAGIYPNQTFTGTPVPVYVDAGGRLGIQPSSARYKQNVENMADASEALLSLRPVTYQYKSDLDSKGTPQFGLIAEEVNKVDPDLVVHDDRHGIYTVRYEAVNAMLLNEFLKQHRKVETQAAELDQLREKAAKVDALENRLGELEQLMKSLKASK